MKLTDEIKEAEETLGSVKEGDLFFAMLNGKTVDEELETGRGKFAVKFPKQRDIMMIDRRVAAMRYGMPASAFDDAANFNIQKIAFLDTVVERGPDWYEAIKKKNRNFSWGDIPDTNFIDEVYVKAWSFRQKVLQELGVYNEKATGGVSDGADVSKVVGDNVFQGVVMSAK